MANLSFLFVDDDPLFRDLMRHFVEEAYPGTQVIALEDATTVAELCMRRTFDCVVLDHDLPGTNGFETATTLRLAFPYLPIILATGAGDEMLVARALKGGVNDYIPKARLSVQSLGRAIHHAIETMSQRRTIDAQREDLETFALALAHDIKQPLRQISIFSDLLTTEIEPKSGAEAFRYLGFITSASGRLSDLVDAMLDYAVLNQAVGVEVVDVGAVAAEICLSLKPYIDERKGRVDIMADCTVVANRALLAQILQNLVINGLKYNHAPTPTLSIHAVVQDTHCDIVVRDNGIGIEKQYLSDIFKPLRRLHARDQFTGTGLGLAIVRKAVMVQNGSISCCSEPGKGSEFQVKLPRASRSQVSPLGPGLLGERREPADTAAPSCRLPHKERPSTALFTLR